MYCAFKSSSDKNTSRLVVVVDSIEEYKVIKNLFLDEALFMGINWNGKIAFNKLLITSKFLILNLVRLFLDFD